MNIEQCISAFVFQLILNRKGEMEEVPTGYQKTFTHFKGITLFIKSCLINEVAAGVLE